MRAGGRVVVVGVGNEYRRDDGVGWAVVARLAERVTRSACRADVVLRTCDGDPARLITLWDAADFAVVVDAAHAHPGHPGRVHRLELDARQLPRGGGSTSSHGLGLGEAVELARVLDRLPGRLVVYAVEGADHSLGSGMSGPVAAAVEPVTRRIAQEIAFACRPVPDPVDRALHGGRRDGCTRCGPSRR
ncbi:hydrogenase maturation protease [Embleya hyalina]|uniref:Peptidase M52 n=1 Tax=Embleya hyalina TaxID=516124 RepID=A0A401YML8_9ACTN|nr:hydrogenase maturation protease [Embleya hyalina]GCD95838.1 peptidase M52 [Embleya hyalina]